MLNKKFLQTSVSTLGFLCVLAGVSPSSLEAVMTVITPDNIEGTHGVTVVFDTQFQLTPDSASAVEGWTVSGKPQHYTYTNVENCDADGALNTGFTCASFLDANFKMLWGHGGHFRVLYDRGGHQYEAVDMDPASRKSLDEVPDSATIREAFNKVTLDVRTRDDGHTHTVLVTWGP